MGTLRFFEEVVSFKIRRTFGFADYIKINATAVIRAANARDRVNFFIKDKWLIKLINL